MNHADHPWQDCPELNPPKPHEDMDPLEQIRAAGCDAEAPSVYATRDGGYICRCVVCARCHHHTGNSHQGHYWAYCRVTGTERDFHMCCPGDCELEAVTS